MKGKVVKCDHREYGFAQLKVAKVEASSAVVDALFETLGDEMQVSQCSVYHLIPLCMSLVSLRFGCRMVTNCLRYHQNFTLLGTQALLPMLPLPIIRSPSMVSNFIQK